MRRQGHFYIGERWCTDVTVLKKMCCSDLETLFMNCKPFYSTWEICSFILVSVYIPPQAHVSSALQKLADLITEQQHPDSVLIILGDFNKANLSCELPKYRQHVTCPTRANRSVDDAVNMGLHFILHRLDRPGTYVRILFVDFSSAFNTIIPDTLQNKLTQLSVPTSVCQWITSFLTDRQQLVRLGKFSSSTRTTSTGAPQGCVLSPLLFSLYMNDCTSKDPSVTLLKFADDTTLIGLIQDGDKSAYRQEVEQLAVWCSLNNLELNTLKTVEMIVDFRRNPPAPPPLSITESTVTAVESFRFLGTTYSQVLKWDNHIDSIVKRPSRSCTSFAS